MRKGRSKNETLTQIESNIFGIDVHPLAVLIARTNFLLACAPLLPARKGPFHVPVYLGDSLMYRSLAGTMEIPDIEIRVDDKTTLWFPESLRHDPSMLDEVISKMVYWADQGTSGERGFQADLTKWGLSKQDQNGLTRQDRESSLVVFRMPLCGAWIRPASPACNIRRGHGALPGQPILDTAL